MLCAGGALACGPGHVEIPVETSIQAKLDVSPFQRVLVAGFVAGGTEEVDANQETVRLLRSQLRSKSRLRVIDADVLPLAEIAQNQNRMASDAEPPVVRVSASTAPSQAAAGPACAAQTLPTPIKDQKDIEPYERLFANTAYWKQIGEEYQNPLIVTGTVLFMARTASNMVSAADRTTRCRLVRGPRTRSASSWTARATSCVLSSSSSMVGRALTIHSETHREEVSYSAQQNMPALSSYFELMDCLVPDFLTALSTQKVRGIRVLLK